MKPHGNGWARTGNIIDKATIALPAVAISPPRRGHPAPIPPSKPGVKPSNLDRGLIATTVSQQRVGDVKHGFPVDLITSPCCRSSRPRGRIDIAPW